MQHCVYQQIPLLHEEFWEKLWFLAGWSVEITHLKARYRAFAGDNYPVFQVSWAANSITVSPAYLKSTVNM